jgi:hypothetical protein
MKSDPLPTTDPDLIGAWLKDPAFRVAVSEACRRYPETRAILKNIARQEQEELIDENLHRRRPHCPR